MDNFNAAVQVVLKNEGGYSDNPYDLGGITNRGISLRFYKIIHPVATAEDLRDLTEDQIIAIYRKYFWDVAPFASIANLGVATAIFDHSVNSGIAPAARVLQKACNDLLVHGIRSLLVVDNVLGEKTLSVTNKLNPDELLDRVREERVKFYENLVENDPSQKEFLLGWIHRARGT